MAEVVAVHVPEMALMDVVFLHGLDGDARKTWTLKGKGKGRGQETSSFWPAWLAEDFDGVAVWSVGYEAWSSGWRGRAMPMQDRAVNLMAQLQNRGIGQRPLCFVTHSMGGLLAKEILLHAAEGRTDYAAFATAARGVVFLGTPNTGSGVTRVVDSLGIVYRATEAVKDLQRNSAHLRHLNDRYRDWACESGIGNLVFFEAYPTKGVRVVDETSANPGLPRVRPIPVDADHIGICKVADRDSLVYGQVKRFITGIISTHVDHASSLESTDDARRDAEETPGERALQVRASRPYLLLETERAIGRAALRADISEFLSRPAEGNAVSTARFATNDTAVMLLIGVPGIGKSALAWDAWKALRSEPGRAERRQFWYSFYDGCGAGSFPGFLRELAAFLGIGPAEEVTPDKVVQALSEQSTLLFLDGIERCLRCYQRPLAIGDLEAAQVQATNPTQWTESDLGFASDDAYRFFVQLTDSDVCRVLATSRVVPSDYFASGGGLRAGVVSRTVGALDTAETQGLLAAVGMDITPVDAATVAATFGGHPLALQLLARQTRRSVDARRDLTGWLRARGYALAGGQGAVAIRERLFANAAAQLPVEARLAVFAAGVMGGSVDLADLGALMFREEADDEALGRLIETISASGLAQETADGRLACHPLSALVAADQSPPDRVEELVKAIGDQLRGRFEEMSVWDDGYYQWFTRGQVSDRAEAMAYCRALVRLREWQAAATFYAEQLHHPICWVVGANFDALKLLRELISGLETEPSSGGRRSDGEVENHPDQFKPFLAHFLLMTGRIEEAGSVLDSMTDGRDWIMTRLTAGHVALHRGDAAGALESATTVLHDTRVSMAYVTGEDVDMMGLMAGRHEYLINEHVSDFIEAAVLCARILLFGGRPAEAALLIFEGLRIRKAVHKQCEGCQGLLVRAAAEFLLATDDLPAAVEAAALGKRLQEGQGKSLQGLLSEVLVRAAETRADTAGSPTSSAALADFLGEAGFVLYQLMLQAASGSPVAVRGLEQAGAVFALSWLAGETRPLPEAQVSRCVGWLVGDECTDLPESEDETLAMTHRALASAGREARAVTPAVLRVNARQCLAEGNADGYRTAMEAALDLDPCDIESLCALASAAARAGDDETALRRLRELFVVYSSVPAYNFAISLVTSDGPLADGLRKILSAFARADQCTQGAYVALAEMERKLGRERAASRWEQLFEAVMPQNRFLGYAKNVELPPHAW
ncbi:hypothetical protein ACIPSA_49455 [Streptomyces sp. NPDC086549]|uniref:hypothetical protein n=1 Tax=Streptomyces sp. NPDC086549 TaxID=3365752 RepID=UPI003824E17E